MNESTQALKELLELQSTGVRFPYSPGFILRQEDRGNVVDLETGEINIIPGDGQRYQPTEKGGAQ